MVEQISNLTIHIDKRLIEAIEVYAKKHNTTVTQLIAEYLYYLVQQDKSITDLPVLRRLSGILPYSCF